MLILIDKILKDLKKNSKYFIIFVTLFLIVFYGEKKINQSKEYKYRSHVMFTQPSATEWVTFNMNIFRQDLYQYLISLETKKKINSLCNLSSSKQTINLKFNHNDFVYSKITLHHQEMADEMCLEKVFNQIILDHYNNHIDNVMANNKILLNYLEAKKKESFSQSIYLSTLPMSFRSPQVIEDKLNRKNIDEFNHIKVIITSIIFSILLTLTLSNFFQGNKKRRG